MARGARRRSRRNMRAGKGEPRHAVIEGSSIPTLGGVAIRAVGHGERGTGGRVHGIIRLLPGGEVAARVTAIRRRNVQTVIAADVAGGARHVSVAVGQRKTKRGVVKFSVRPLGDGMALCARSGVIWEPRGDVIGNVAAKCRSLVPIA